VRYETLADTYSSRVSTAVGLLASRLEPGVDAEGDHQQ
jgi:hypothetical protein